jgi:hypothetical protein
LRGFIFLVVVLQWVGCAPTTDGIPEDPGDLDTQAGIIVSNGLGLKAFAGELNQNNTALASPKEFYAALASVPLTAEGLLGSPDLAAMLAADPRCIDPGYDPDGPGPMEPEERYKTFCAREFLEYAYSCAMPRGSEMTVQVGDFNIKFHGFVGIAPEWGAEDGSCLTAECQEWMTACLAARTNTLVRQPLLLRGSHEAVAEPSEIELDCFTQREGSYYGNLFQATADPLGEAPLAYSCAGPASATRAHDLRFCSTVGSDGGCKDEDGERVIEVVGDCVALDPRLSSGSLCSEGCSPKVSCDNTNEIPETCYTSNFRCNEMSTGSAYSRVLTVFTLDPEPTADEPEACTEYRKLIVRDKYAPPEEPIEPPPSEPVCETCFATALGAGCHEEVTPPAVVTEGGESGNIYVAGRFTVETALGSDQFTAVGASKWDGFLSKLSSDGTVLWSKQIDTEGFLPGNVATDADGNVYLAAVYSTSINLDGGPAETPTDGMATVLAKFNSSGELVWQRHYQSYALGIFGQRNARVAVRGENVVLATEYGDDITGPGVSAGAIPNLSDDNDYGEILVVKFDRDGNVGWFEALGGNEDTQLLGGLDLGTDGSVVIAGRFYDSAEFGATTFSTSSTDSSTERVVDGYVVKLDNAGDLDWAWQFGTPTSRDGLTGVSVHNDGRIAITGYFEKTITIGPTTLQGNPGGSNPVENGVVGVLSSGGVPTWLDKWGDDSRDRGEGVTWEGNHVAVFGFFAKAHVLASGDSDCPDEPLFFADDVYSLTSLQIDSKVKKCWLASQNEKELRDLLIRIHDGSSGALVRAQRVGGYVAEVPKGLGLHPGGDIILSIDFAGAPKVGQRYVNSFSGSADGFIPFPTDALIARIRSAP